MLAVLILSLTSGALLYTRARGPSSAALIAFQRHIEGGWDIFVMGMDGVGVRRLTAHASIDWEPAWSPDGRWIVFTSFRGGNASLYRVRPGGHDLQLYLVPPERYHSGLSPDGEWLLFSSHYNGNADLYRQRPGATQMARLTDHLANDWSPRWAPDGQWVVFVSQRDGNAEIYRIGADGTAIRRLTRHPALDWSPAVSPDGNWIAFVSDRAGNDELYRMQADGTQVRRLTFYAGSDGAPAWSPPIDHRWRGGPLLVASLSVALVVGLWPNGKR